MQFKNKIAFCKTIISIIKWWFVMRSHLWKSQTMMIVLTKHALIHVWNDDCSQLSFELCIQFWVCKTLIWTKSEMEIFFPSWANLDLIKSRLVDLRFSILFIKNFSLLNEYFMNNVCSFICNALIQFECICKLNDSQNTSVWRLF